MVVHKAGWVRILLVIAGFSGLATSTVFQAQINGLFGVDGAKVLFAISCLSAVASSIVNTLFPAGFDNPGPPAPANPVTPQVSKGAN